MAGDPAPTRTTGAAQFPQALEIRQAGHEAFVDGDGEDDQIAGRQADAAEAEIFVHPEAVEVALSERIEGWDAGGAAGGAEVEEFFARDAPKLVVGLRDVPLGGRRDLVQIGDAADFGEIGE